MQDALAWLIDAFMAHPTAGVGLGVAGLFLVMVWAVVSSSYRYR
ncbi:MAG: hypothetical protein ACRDJ4_11940 [Actinomycetota bacterium]